jgi:hypothetical protein
MTDLVLLNNKIQDFFNNIDSRISLIENKVNKLEIIITKIEVITNNQFNNESKNQNILHINNTLNNINQSVNSNSNIIINLIKEEMNIKYEDIKKAMIYKDYRTILYLFKLYYKNKSNQQNVYPIKIKGKRTFEYYNINWIHDANAHYIKHTIFMNIQTELYKYNNLDNINDVDDIYDNQVFINKLSDDKYKRDVFKHIIDEVSNYN